MRTIDADKLKQHFAWWHEGGEEADRQAEIFEQIIDAQPTIQPKKGKWKEQAIENVKAAGIEEVQIAKCSACGLYHTTPYMYYFSDYNYCPNCGARMEEQE